MDQHAQLFGEHPVDALEVVFEKLDQCALLIAERLGLGPQLRAGKLVCRVEQPVGHGHMVGEKADRLLGGGPLRLARGYVQELDGEALEAGG